MTFSEIKDNLVDYINSNRKQALIILGALAVVLIALVLIIIVAANQKTEKAYTHDVVTTEEMLIPDGPEMQRDYNVSRKSKDKWTEEEADEWFTIPSTKDIENLQKSNNDMINQVVGAAP